MGEASESLLERVPQIRDLEGVGARCGACESKGVLGKWHGACKGKLRSQLTKVTGRKTSIHFNRYVLGGDRFGGETLHPK